MQSKIKVGKILQFIQVEERLWCATEQSIFIWDQQVTFTQNKNELFLKLYFLFLKKIKKITSSFHQAGCNTLTQSGLVIWANSLQDNSLFVYDGKVHNSFPSKSILNQKYSFFF